MRKSIWMLLLPLSLLAGEVTFTGENWSQALIGKKENPELPANYFEYDEYQNQGWRYFRDVFTFEIGIQRFTFDGKFYIDQPTMGFHPKEKYYYRELFKRRTLGWNGDHIQIKAGNFETSIGRGLTLSLQDDHTVELSNILDGALFTHESDFLSATLFAGRGQEKNKVITLPGSEVSEVEDYTYRDGVYGFSMVFYPFYKSELLAATSFGTGLVLMRDGVEDFVSHDIDTTEKQELLPVQKRRLIWLPSLFISSEIGPVSLYSEYARLIPQSMYYDDSLLSEESSVIKHGFASYSSLGLSLGDFMINGEYLNYFYGKENTYFGELLAGYTDAPTGRHKQTWHLLTKHTVVPHVGDFIGYNSSVSWFGLDGHEFMLVGSFGGLHKEEDGKKSLFAVDKKYHELYLEWNGTVAEKFESRVGLDMGIIDKDHPHLNSYTLGAEMVSKNLFGNWGLGATVEGQMNVEELLAAKDLEDLRSIAIGQLPDEDPDEINALEYEALVDLLRKGTITKDEGAWTTLEESWFNSAFILSLFIKEKFEISALLEQETFYRNDHTLALVNDVQSRSEWYKSLAFSANFNRHHSLEVALGDFARSKVCNMGTCTKVPSYKGVKITFKSTF